MKSFLFFVKSIFFGLLVGFFVLFFMPQSKLPFNWQTAKEWYQFYQIQKAEYTKEKNRNQLSIENISFANAVAKASPSVVSLNVFRPKRIRSDSRLAPNQKILDYSVGVGSGVILSNKGYVVTNYHVIDKAESVSINLPDGRRRFVELVGYDVETDIAVLKTDLQGLDSAELATSDDVKKGDIVMAIGSPFGRNQSVSLGIVSAIAYQPLPPRIQTDAAINNGNSGGALINTSGEVVGINQMILSSAGGGQTGINYAIPISRVKRIVEDIIEYGRVKKNWLGLRLGELPRSAYQRFYPNLEYGSGLVVELVDENSPADIVGIQPGDIIFEFDGKTPSGLAGFYEMFYEVPVGAEVGIRFIRNKKVQLAKIQLFEKPQLEESS
ncbi:MAG: trypsin-like peptidase domain-containing protein [Kangiellaceae bacterium]|nr:trypsin-like peptidase domain-containing protein [Kangiellaceae bacterium]MCW9018280.1 trypsin-like peptidase domain-containing protein [Kangiellaceae bacterium]